MSKNFDMIATVDIDISNPLVDETSFDNLLLVGPLPSELTETPIPKVGVYTNIDDVAEAGWAVFGENADPIGVAASVAFSQSPRPSKIYIAPIQNVTTGGSETEVQEDVLETIKRAMDVPGWYVVCTAGVEASNYQSIADYIETQEKMFCFTTFDAFKNGSVEPQLEGELFRSLCVLGGESAEQDASDAPANNYYANVAFVTKWLSYNSGSETSALKPLNGIAPAALSGSQMRDLESNNINFVIEVANKDITMCGKTIGGEWCDVIRFRDWLKNDMQLRIVKLFITNPKIPYTDAGIALVQNQMLAALKAGRAAGGIAEDEFEDDGSVIPGYVTSVPLSANISSAEKASRRLTNCKFKARLAGAIHFAELKGSLTYEL